MNVVSYGGGTNSTAMLIGMQERHIPVDLILFADTGSEKPHTYAHVLEFSEWLVERGLPPIKTIRGEQAKQIEDGSLEGECLRRKTLPSIAFGFKTCSQKWKRQPYETYLKSIGAVDVVTHIGFDADEPQRAKPYPNVVYPLIEWGWGRDECIEAIDKAGLSRPGKSACFFCPSSKPREIIQLGKDYPDFLERALAMEANAELTSVKGLGRNFAWADLIRADRAQLDMFRTPVEIDCGCYDGEAA